MTQQQHRILLIEPPFYRLYKDTYSLDRYPLSLGYLGGTAHKQTDWQVMAYCADFHPEAEEMRVSYLAGEGFDRYLHRLKDPSGGVWDEIRSTLTQFQPGVVAISAKSQNFRSAQIVAKLAKQIDPSAIVMVGGPHPSMVGRAVLDCPDIDICACGEGERTIVELLDAIASGKALDGVNGIIFRKGGEIVETPRRALIEDLDTLCFPHETAPEILKDYDQYPLSAFRYIFATRGCPYDCFFCASRKIWTRKPRCRSPENVVAEIHSLRKLGLRSIHFADDTFGIHNRYLHALCSALKTHCRGLKWSAEIHVRLANEQNVSLMKAAGCHLIQIGVESGNNEMLKKIRKNITIEDALAAADRMKRHGIDVEAYFMVGFPEETEQTLHDTIAAMEKINCNILVYSIFTPYPGTESFEFCKEHGLVDDTFDAALYNHQSRANCFCLHIRIERFRELVSEVEAMVDRRNALNRRRQMFNIRRKLWRMRELGLRESIRRGVKILLGG